MYTYSKLLHAVNYYGKNGVEVGSIGFSEDGRPIPYIFVGNKSDKNIFITAGIHAREHVGCCLCMQQVEFALNNFCCSKLNGGIYFIPMLNPDGNVLIQKGVGAMNIVDKVFLKKLFKTQNRKLLKANARGVDLNVNFDANWGSGAQNILVKGSANYIGKCPFSEAETKALRKFTLKKKPLSTISYHCLGQEIYWEFGQKGEEYIKDKKIVEFLNEPLGYKVLADDGKSAGGYKDWCIQKLKIPSFTIELCPDEYLHPFTDYKKAQAELDAHLDLPIRLLKKVISDK